MKKFKDQHQQKHQQILKFLQYFVRRNVGFQELKLKPCDGCDVMR